MVSVTITSSKPAVVFPVLLELDAVRLEELSARARLLVRHDRKYVMPLPSLEALLQRLTGELQVLEIGGHRCFRYESIYFDSVDLRSFHAASRGRPVRWKLRTRSYLDTRSAWTEVKVQDRRGQTVKHRQARAFGCGSRLGAADRAFFDRVVPEPIGSRGLAPTLRTTFQRMTLLELTSESRVTIDVGLRCQIPKGPTVVYDEAIVETKTAGGPSPFDRFLWSEGHRPLRMSKYGTGLAALRPELPSNRWHRQLRSGWSSPRPSGPLPWA